MTPLEGSPGQLPTEALRPRSIPRIFHQTWRDENIDEHSDFAAESQAAIRRFHPGYEYRFWTDRDIGHFMRREVKPAFPDLFDTYERLPKKIMKIDFVRYCWMYLLGGVYCDLDVIHLRSADELIAPGGVVFIGRGWMTGGRTLPISVHQAWLASCPQHPVWLKIMRFIRRQLDDGVTETLELTGPNGVSAALVSLNLTEEYRDFTIHPHRLWYQGGYTKTPREEAGLLHKGTHRWTMSRAEKIRAVLEAMNRFFSRSSRA
jgi:hypothetical protein